MIVGTLHIELSLFGNRSLKDKRKVVRSVLDRVTSRFNAAGAEVDDMDEHRRASLGFAVVSNESSHANAMLDQIADFVEAHSAAPVVSRRIELVTVRGEYDDWEEWTDEAT